MLEKQKELQQVWYHFTTKEYIIIFSRPKNT